MSFELKNVVLTYFPIQGRAAPLRLLMEDADVEYTESNDVAAFREDKMDCELYPFNQLPRLTVNGIHLAQQGTILRLLAKAKGYTGTGDLLQDAVVDMLQDACEDLNIAYLKGIYGGENAAELLKTFVLEYVPKVFRQFEHMFKKNSVASGYLAYEKPSFAEFHLFYLLTAITRLNPAALSEYPTLSAWFERMKNRPRIKSYLESGRQKEMLNGSPSGQSAIV